MRWSISERLFRLLDKPRTMVGSAFDPFDEVVHLLHVAHRNPYDSHYTCEQGEWVGHSETKSMLLALEGIYTWLLVGF
jgi:hypothetical protein